MVGDLVQRQHRRHARLGAVEDGHPLVARPGRERGREPLPQHRVPRDVVLRRQRRRVETEPVEQLGVEPRFQRADGDVPAVGAGVGVVVGRAAVQEVGLPLVGPVALTVERPGHLHEQARPVDHRGVDDLAAARRARLQHRREDADEQQHGAAAEVADEVQRRHRSFARPADRVQRTGERHVVDVVPGLTRHRTVLTPPGHAAVDQPRVAGVAVGRPDPEAFGDARPVALDQDVRVVDQAQHRVATRGVLEVGRDPAATAQDGVGAIRVTEPQSPGRPVDAHDVGPEIGEHHGRVRTRSDSGQLHDPQPAQRPRPRSHPDSLRSCCHRRDLRARRRGRP